MIILLSSSKRLNFNGSTEIKYGDEPFFIKDSVKLIRLMKKLSISELIKLLSISHNLAETNYNWFQEWEYPFIKRNVRPAFAAFAGDVYDGLKYKELSPNQVEIADKRVRILSGLYGVLKPTDIILPYRLEMGTDLKGKNFNNLYDFWKSKLTRYINKELLLTKNKVIVNLASLEYTNVIDFRKTNSTVITPVFLEFKNGDYKFVSISAKRARGLMTKFILEENIDDVEQIKLFNYNGYSFDEPQSNKKRWVFVK